MFCLFRCRFNIVLYLVVNIFLALAIAIGNATILGVLSHKKQNVQSIYRLSLAVADFIMGVVVIPMSIGTAYNQLVHNPPLTKAGNVTDYVTANDSGLSMQSVVVELKGPYQNNNLSNYVAVSAIGFFNVLSLSMSVFSLVAATFDRFVAMHRPLKYDHSKAICAAKITVISLWFVGLTLAILPIVIPDVDYTLYISSFVSNGGNPFLMMYGIGFMVVLMWFLMIATYVAARPSLRRHDRQRQSNDERRHLATLGIMMTVFTICIVPTAIVLVISVNSPYLNLENPLEYDPVASAKLSSAVILAGLVLVSNSLWNCFIYSIRETSFRIAAKLLYKRIAQHLKLNHVWSLI